MGERPYKDVAFTMPCGWVVVYSTLLDDGGQPIASTLAEVEKDRIAHSAANPHHDATACRRAMEARRVG